MRRFFVTPEAVQNDTVVFDAELARHMGKVLRLTSGEQVTVSTGDGTAYLVTLDEFGKDYVTGRIIEKMDNLQETSMEVVLYQGMPKGDKLELIIQKCTELGVSQVIPVETSRSVVHLDGNKAGKKLERWQKIAASAAEQSGRGRIPQVLVLDSFDAAVKRASAADFSALFYENEHTRSLRAAVEASTFTTAALMTGPEGGLTEQEVQKAQSAGMEICSLGPRILRCETAPLCALSAILYASGNSKKYFFLFIEQFAL